jgi:hypothetical protein
MAGDLERIEQSVLDFGIKNTDLAGQPVIRGILPAEEERKERPDHPENRGTDETRTGQGPEDFLPYRRHPESHFQYQKNNPCEEEYARDPGHPLPECVPLHRLPQTVQPESDLPNR